MTEKIDNNNGPNKITGIGKDTLNSIIENAKSQLPIEAIGIGGSLATKRQDTYSDFDILYYRIFEFISYFLNLLFCYIGTDSINFSCFYILHGKF